MCYLQEPDPFINEDTPSTSSTRVENSSSAIVDPGQETDSECEGKQKEASLFLLQLKERTKLQQSVVDNVVKGATMLLKKSVHRLKRKVTELLDSEGLGDLAASDSFQDLWRNEMTPFEGLETNHHQEEYMKRTFPYVVGIKTYLRGEGMVLTMYLIQCILHRKILGIPPFCKYMPSTSETQSSFQ